jgi:hypothetical protein
VPGLDRTTLLSDKFLAAQKGTADFFSALAATVCSERTPTKISDATRNTRVRTAGFSIKLIVRY